MSVYKKDNKFTSLLIILASLFILVFFTKGVFYSMQENFDKSESLNSSLDEKTIELQKLETLDKDLKTWDKKKEINMFLKSFKEDEIVSYIYDYVESLNNSDNMIIVKSLSLNSPVESELGFKEVDMNLDVIVWNVEVLKNLLDFLTASDAAYKFFITEFSFDNDGRTWAYSINIPLRLFYK